MSDLLALAGVDTFYGASHILRDISLRLARRAVGLLGRNGMGKTTLLRTIAGLVRPRRGQIAFDGSDIAGARPSMIARNGLARWFPEGRGIFRNLTVHENLQLACRSNRQGRTRALASVYDMFPRLAERRHHWGDQLSGGEQQMLTIGRALVTQPMLLMIDEATEGLAPKIRDDIWQTLRRVRADGVAILVVDKNIDDLLALCDRHVILVKGEVVFAGSSEALRCDADLIHTHLGI